MQAVDALVEHVRATEYARLPPAAVTASKTFILDTLGVGISGSRHPRTAQVKRAALGWGEARQARVWGSGEWLPASAAALVNAYQVHNQEYDCVHERALVHATTAVLPALLAHAERSGGCSGKDLIAALVAGVDVAAFIGMTPLAPMRFFRPATCGVLGAALAVAKLAGLNTEALRNAFGIAYSQLSGSMQAHIEGSPTLALQLGFSARAAVSACDLAAEGFAGPRDVLDGRYGYFTLYESEPNWAAASSDLGRVHQVTRLSHKPFPTGRATHGGIDGVLTLQKQHGFTAADVARVRISAPPMIQRLVGRPVKPDMEMGYARICMGYCVATALLSGSIGVEDFDAERLNDPRRLTLAARVDVACNGVTDENALGPQAVEVILNSGTIFSIDVPATLGHPDRPLESQAQRRKFAACCLSGQPSFSTEEVEALAAEVEVLDETRDVRSLLDLCIGNRI